MQHINDELINDTHTYNGGRRGGKGGSNLRRNCKISIGVKGELRKKKKMWKRVLHTHTASSSPLPLYTQVSAADKDADRHLRRCM
jgi:hypothetical protein